MVNVVLQTGEERRGLLRKAATGLGGAFFERVKAAKTILVKPTLVHHEFQLASTHVDAIRGILDVIREHSNAQIFIGDAGYMGTKAAFRSFGYEQLTNEYTNVSLVDLNDDATCEGMALRRDGLSAPIRRSKLAHDVDMRISVSPLSAHKDFGLACAVYNWVFGTWVVPPRIGLLGRVWPRSPFLADEGVQASHATIAALYKQLPCDVAFVDGLYAMQGNGPIKGEAVHMGVAFAGMDAAAVDTAAATRLGIDPHEIGYLRLCADIMGEEPVVSG